MDRHRIIKCLRSLLVTASLLFASCELADPQTPAPSAPSPRIAVTEAKIHPVETLPVSVFILIAEAAILGFDICLVHDPVKWRLAASVPER